MRFGFLIVFHSFIFLHVLHVHSHTENQMSRMSKCCQLDNTDWPRTGLLDSVMCTVSNTVVYGLHITLQFACPLTEVDISYFRLKKVVSCTMSDTVMNELISLSADTKRC